MRNREETNRNGPVLHRRDFLKGSGVAVAATAMATAVHEEAAGQEKKKANVVAGPTEVTLNVNGKDYKLTIEPRVTLMDALRNDLNLTGAKYADDRTATGADTVIIDGKAVLATSRLAIQCQGQKIQTIESLTNGKVDDVVAGFSRHDAQQCGFCTPGFVMATRAFFNKNPKPTLDEVRKGLGGNICRCGTYANIIECCVDLAKKGGA